MRRVIFPVIASGLAALALWAPSPAAADLVSKTYQFREGVILEVGAATADGVRLDSVQFELSAGPGTPIDRLRGLVRAWVSVSNTNASSKKVGIAIALYDEQARLLGVANGGSKLASIKPGRQKTFEIVFDGVNSEAHQASKFQISVESKP